jgi:antitoxin component YwqK of YwqJK toxin-antitoxin module
MNLRVVIFGLVILGCARENVKIDIADIESIDTLIQVNYSDSAGNLLGYTQFNLNYQINGARVLLDEKNMVKSVSFYKNDTLNGFTATLFKNELIEVGTFENHNAQGIFYDFTKSDSVIYQLLYQNGIVVDTLCKWRN